MKEFCENWGRTKENMGFEKYQNKINIIFSADMCGMSGNCNGSVFHFQQVCFDRHKRQAA